MTHYKLAAPNAAYEDFDGEAVMLDLATGKYFALSKSASFIVEALLGGQSLADVIALCAPARNVDALAIEALVQRLAGFGLLEAAPEPAARMQPELSRLVDEAPTVDVYDDLADLIIADPIHEVDEERGWPVRKADA